MLKISPWTVSFQAYKAAAAAAAGGTLTFQTDRHRKRKQ